MYTGFSTPHRFPSSSSGFPPPFPGGAWSRPRVVPHVAANSPPVPFGLLPWRDNRLRAADSERCDWIRPPSRLSSQPRPCQAVDYRPAHFPSLFAPAWENHERPGSQRPPCGYVVRINYPEVPFSRPSSRVTLHVLRHTTAMALLQGGVDTSSIALWLGHESPATTHIYLEANLALKEKILGKMETWNGTKTGRYRPEDPVLKFLKSL